MANSLKLIAAAGVLALGLLPVVAFAADDNATIVVKAMTGLFVDRDASVVDRYWAVDYIQHNPSGANGNAELKGVAGMLPPGFSYEPGMVIASDDLVMIHGRYTGAGPKPMIAVDIFRLQDGKLVEHWDVLQEEVPAAQTKSGNAMFSPNEQ